MIVTALKRAEDDDGYVLRAYEATGRATAAVIKCPLLETTLEIEFGPYEIKTVKIEDNGIARETSLLEQAESTE
jgi:alpha-mannosidase